MYLVINLGLKSIRGIIFNTYGKKIYFKSYKINTIINNEIVEQKPRDYKVYLNKILLDIKKKKLSKKVKYISTTTSASCLMFLNKNKKNISNTIMVLDTRINHLVSNYNKILNSNIFSLDDQILKVLWFIKNKKKQKNINHVLNSGDYLNYIITGKIFTDKLNYNKLDNNKYNLISGLVKKKLINKSLFPKPYDIGSIFDLEINFLKRYNFKKETKFILTTYDAICATIGSANFRKPYNNVSEVSGTVTSVRLISKHLPKIKNKNLKISKIPLLNINIIGASNNLGGGFLGWVKDFLQTRFNFDSLKKYIKKSKTNLIFLPLIFGDRYLEINSSNGGLIQGLKRNSTIYDFVKAGILSSGFMSKKYIDDLQKEGFKIKSITLSGGLTRISIINKIKSKIFNKKTYLCKEYESTSFGCFLIMKAKIEKINFSSICKLIKSDQVIYKNKKDNYAINYKKFLTLLKNFKSLNTSVDEINKSKIYNTNL